MKVKLTWRHKHRTYSKECELLEPDEELVTKDGRPVPKEIIDSVSKDGMVWFHGEESVFIIEAQKIVSIVPLKE